MKGKVKPRALNVRREPSITSDRIGSLSQDTVVEIIGGRNEWLEIVFDGLPAFIHGHYVELIDEQQGDSSLSATDELHGLALPAENRLPLTGSGVQKIVARTWNQYGNLLESLSAKVGIDVGAAVAVLVVESGGSGFSRNGKMVIRFENHWFWKLWGRENDGVFRTHFRFSESAGWKDHQFRSDANGGWQKFHGNQAREWIVLDIARGLDDTAALKSVSMGAPQIMGFNHERIGYGTVQEMYDRLSGDIRYHILGLFDFFDAKIIRALRRYDFVDFARRYNGSGQAEEYGDRIQERFEVFRELMG